MTVQAEVQAVERRRRWRRFAIGSALVAALVGGVPYAMSFTPAAGRVPSRVLAGRDLAAIAGAMDARGPQPSALDSIAQAAARRSLTPPAPAALQDAARIWVDTLNAWNPHAILYAKPDARGNLYVAFDAWFYVLTEDDQMLALDRLGSTWRQYLKDTFGAWGPPGPGNDCFAPGIVVVDDQGLVGRNLNCRVELARRRPA